MAIDQQLFLANFIQKKCWEKTKNQNIIKKLEDRVHALQDELGMWIKCSSMV